MSQTGKVIIGYDPVFVDVLVHPYGSDGKILNNLPPLGEHVPNTGVWFVAGGNGFNVAKTMSYLHPNVTFVATMTPHYMGLAQEAAPNLNLLSVKEVEPNYTIALHLGGGEIQMNSVNQGFGVEGLTRAGLWGLLQTDLVPFSNIGLNKEGEKLFLEMAAFIQEVSDLTTVHQEDLQEGGRVMGRLAEEIEGLVEKKNRPGDVVGHQTIDMPDPNTGELPTISVDKTYYFDPSTLAGFGGWHWLPTFLTDIFPALPGQKILSVNEHEAQKLVDHGITFGEILDHPNVIIVQHESGKVQTWESTNEPKNETKTQPTVTKVEKLHSDEIVTSVGAGDSFVAGLLVHYLSSRNAKDATKAGVQTARNHLLGKYSRS